MSNVMISVRLPEDLLDSLEIVAESTERSKTYLIKKAIEQYLGTYADYQIALDRLNDAGDEIISAKEMKKRLAARD